MVNRRDILKFSAAALPTAALLPNGQARAEVKPITRRGGEDYSHLSGTKHKAIPTTCAMCTDHCPILGYVEDGRIAKIEGHPGSRKTRGALCPRGQAGLNQVYDPDRILDPLKRTGARGEGEWEKISWEAALAELTSRLAPLREQGRPEGFMVHHGDISASSTHVLKAFLSGFGTTPIDATAGLGERAKQTALELTWGPAQDVWDVEKSRMILNLGSNCLESGPNHLALVTRIAPALAEGRTKLITADVRLSNTAARSDQWLPIKPGSDLALILAMCNVVVEQNLIGDDGKAFLQFCKVTENSDDTLDQKIAALKAHLAPYTPTWAAEVTGIDKKAIEEIAIEFATTKPACIISGRGTSTRGNGVETERAIQMLAAITGNVDKPGTRCLSVKPHWQHPAINLTTDIDDSILDQRSALQVLAMIANGKIKRPEVLLWYEHNPAFVNPDTQATIDVLHNEDLLPYTVAVSSFYDETAALADLILPQAVFLERWDWDDDPCPDQIAEFALRQPVIAPRGQARDFKDVCCDLATALNIPLDFATGEAFVAASCKMTPEIGANGGLKDLAMHGLVHPKGATKSYSTYEQPLTVSVLSGPGVILDAETGVYWDWTKSAAANEEAARAQGYRETKGAYAGYVGQRIDGHDYLGFSPGSTNKSGYFELYSDLAAARGLGHLPTYSAISEHDVRTANEMVLTTFTVSVQADARSQNSRWLSEIHHDNPAWINPAEAQRRNINEGDQIKIKSPTGEIVTTAKVTNLITPGVIALSDNGGHWQYGRYASGKDAPFADEHQAHYSGHQWWHHYGTSANWIIPHAVDPVSGQQRWNDTIVSVFKT